MKRILFTLFIGLISLNVNAQIGSGLQNAISKKIPTETDAALNTRGVSQRVDKIGFTKTISNNVDTEWGAIIGSTGSGMTINQTGGNLVVTSGTTARSESIIRSNLSWQGGIRLRAKVTLSQRIANNNFFVELVDVVGDGLAYTITSATTIVVTIPSNPLTSQNVGQSIYLGGFAGTGTFLSGRYPIASVSGNDVTFTVSAFAAGTGTLSAFGWNYYQLQYQGTTATQANFDVQRNGWAVGVTTATINTTASPGHIAIVTGNDMNATFADQLSASAAGTILTTNRASRSENVPDDIPLRLQIRVVNGSTAPASTTTLTLGMVAVSNFSATDVSLQDVRPQSTQAALPVEILRSQASIGVNGSVTSVQGAAGSTAWLANPLIPVGAVSDAGAKTVTVNGTTITNTAFKGVQILFNVGAVTGTTPTLVCKIQGSTDAGTNWYDIPTANTATLIATGTYGIMIYPSITAVAGMATTGTTAQINAALPRTWRAVYTVGGTTPSFTLTNMQYVYLP